MSAKWIAAGLTTVLAVLILLSVCHGETGFHDPATALRAIAAALGWTDAPAELSPVVSKIVPCVCGALWWRRAWARPWPSRAD